MDRKHNMIFNGMLGLAGDGASKDCIGRGSFKD